MKNVVVLWSCGHWRHWMPVCVVKRTYVSWNLTRCAAVIVYWHLLEVAVYFSLKGYPKVLWSLIYSSKYEVFDKSKWQQEESWLFRAVVSSLKIQRTVTWFAECPRDEEISIKKDSAGILVMELHMHIYSCVLMLRCSWYVLQCSHSLCLWFSCNTGPSKGDSHIQSTRLWSC